MAEQHAGAFEERTVFDQAREASPAFGTIPLIRAEGGAFRVFERCDDVRLQREQILAHCRHVDRGHYRASRARQPMSRRNWAPSKRIASTTA